MNQICMDSYKSQLANLRTELKQQHDQNRILDDAFDVKAIQLDSLKAKLKDLQTTWLAKTKEVTENVKKNV